MTQEQALEEFKKLRPDCVGRLKAERVRSIGYIHGFSNEFNLWDYSEVRPHLISSRRSWEHALAIAKSGDEDCWPEDDSPIAEAA